MNRIVQCGLVAGLLIFGAMGMGGAADDATQYSEDYKQGFYDGGVRLGQANAIGTNLVGFYWGLGGNETIITEKNQGLVNQYNNESLYFNQVIVYNVNGIIAEIFGKDDSRALDLYLPELHYIT